MKWCSPPLTYRKQLLIILFSCMNCLALSQSATKSELAEKLPGPMRESKFNFKSHSSSHMFLSTISPITHFIPRLVKNKYSINLKVAGQKEAAPQERDYRARWLSFIFHFLCFELLWSHLARDEKHLFLWFVVVCVVSRHIERENKIPTKNDDFIWRRRAAWEFLVSVSHSLPRAAKKTLFANWSAGANFISRSLDEAMTQILLLESYGNFVCRYIFT